MEDKQQREASEIKDNTFELLQVLIKVKEDLHWDYFPT